jgi:hypothetical protein
MKKPDGVPLDAAGEALVVELVPHAAGVGVVV